MRITQIFPVDSDRCTDMALLNERLTRKEQRLAGQLQRKELLQRRISNTEEDIKTLKAALHYAGQSTEGTPRIHIAYKDIPRFFERASLMYDRLCHRMHCHINYTCFCIAIHLHYDLESSSHRRLSLTTVVNYFKRERE